MKTKLEQLIKHAESETLWLKSLDTYELDDHPEEVIRDSVSQSKQKKIHKHYLKQLKKIQAEQDSFIETLSFYADPGTYVGIGFFPDPPSGDFMEDFSKTELGEKPGKRARNLIEEDK